MGMRGTRLGTLAAVVAFVASACGSPSASPTPLPSLALPTLAPPNATVVRWFVGLGKGNDVDQISAERSFVRAYNASQKEIFISLEVVPSESAAATLKLELANGIGPDIVGPVGVADRDGFNDDFMDLSPEITRAGFDTTRYPSAMVDLFKRADGAQIGLPYLIYPAFVFYNKDLFTKYGLPDLPKRVGEQWNGADWTWDALAGAAALLTRDKTGKKATDAAFDASNIVQYGMDFQWADARSMASCWAAGSFIGADGKAAIPQAWSDAWTWYYDLIWNRHVAPTSKVANSALLNRSSTVASGRVAMAVSWAWAIPTYGSLDAHGASQAQFGGWDIGVLPSHNGVTSSPIDADTFAIVNGTAHPAAAFKAMTEIMADPSLQAAYGGMPAATSAQAAWFAKQDTLLEPIFPGHKVSWSVLTEMENYPANPSPEADLPNAAAVNAAANAFYARLQGTSGLTMTNEIATLQRQIQKAFDQAASPTGT
jgi:multiple sugar transport system substrate-binding protein